MVKITSAIHGPFTGTKKMMKHLEKDFISGKYTPFAKEQGEVPKKTVTKRPGPAQGDDKGASAKATNTAVKKLRKRSQPEPGKILCISSQSGLCLLQYTSIKRNEITLQYMSTDD